ncbi:hypothetical protein [Methylobacterium brachythecii]|uniref:Beta-barrel assembly machine subunit BamF n=1 Tax=Methylobacterium brachythecii TaxID=1176177 RepID=A0A7W6AFZ8_9HYPH|nr:hypothetical protein [Methylobacterium brachythecii]MBB3901978.1 hypothetical protein [Methylobacterium brachythecii]GLS43360.1 hypothetical protein GCM10007884_13450 [Methylobacterium brachythecii]
MLSSRLPGLAVALLAASIATGCSSDVNPMKAAMVGAGYGPKAVETPEFIESSRRSGSSYMPVGKDEPKRPIRARNATAQKSLEADLEAARTRNEARGKTAEGAGKGIAKGLKPAEAPAE